MKQLSTFLAAFAAFLTVAGAGFFELPEDRGRALPADKVYPNGRIFPIMTYTGGSKSDQMKKDGCSVIGPVYGKNHDVAIENAKKFNMPVVFSIRAKQDGVVVNKDFFRRSKIKMDPEKIAANIREIVTNAVKNYPNIAFFYLTPEELRHWKTREYDYIKIALDAVHSTGAKQPVWMYTPGHYGMGSFVKYADRLDVMGKGCYTNYSGYKYNRVWVRYSVDIMKKATASSKEVDLIIAVLEMFRTPPEEEMNLITSWARHDFYASIIEGAKGIAIFSLAGRKGFGAAHKLYYAAYSQAAKEVTLPGGLGDIFLFGERRQDLKWSVSAGKAQLKIQVPRKAKDPAKIKTFEYPSIGIANIAHARGRYLFMVNSDNADVSGVISGMPAGTVVKDAVTGEKVAVAGNGSVKLTFKALEVKLFKLERN